MPGSDRYFLELSARVSLKVGTKYIIVLLYLNATTIVGLLV